MGNQRKVRFTLPETKVISSAELLHGTYSYVNGTLIQKPITVEVIQYRAMPKNSVPISRHCQMQADIDFSQTFPVSCLKQRKLSAPIAAKYYDDPRLPPEVIQYRSRTSLPELRQEICGIVTRPRQPRQIEDLRKRHIVIVSAAPPKPSPRNQMEEELKQKASERYFQFRLERFEDMFHKRRIPITTVRRLPSDLPRSKPDCDQQSEDKATSIVGDLLERWRHMRTRAKPKFSDENIHGKISTEDQRPFSVGSRAKSDVRRFGCYKMSLEQTPHITTLLRASRDADEGLLKIVLTKILYEGISKEALNATDQSGRTAISYICSTSLTNFLDIFLQIPGIDVNKPDNEGNTPLHFAAQAGQSEIMNMLITRCRSLKVDTKNNLGFTPLMKAALQGRTRCAKLLLFAGASPVETDSGRGFRAEQWARFCGRYSCAEMIEKCARARLLEKTTSVRAANELKKQPVIRSKTNPSQGTANESFGLKLRKALPFKFSQKDKTTQNENCDKRNKKFVEQLASATLCASGPLAANGKSQVMTTLLRPLEVPKLEVTPANNQQMIKKYESKLSKITMNSSPKQLRN